MIYFDSKSQRWTVEIDRVVRERGEAKRIRRRKRLPAGTTEGQARAIAAKMESEEVARAMAVDGAEGWEAYVQSLRSTAGSWMHQAIAKCRHRRPGTTLTIDQLTQLMLRSKGRCEVTGLRFTTACAEEGQKRPFFHSIDRIRSDEGYTVNNVRLVCFAVNMAMSNWGEEVFAELARGYVFNRYSAIYALREGGEISPDHASA